MYVCVCAVACAKMAAMLPQAFGGVTAKIRE